MDGVYHESDECAARRAPDRARHSVCVHHTAAARCSTTQSRGMACDALCLTSMFCWSHFWLCVWACDHRRSASVWSRRKRCAERLRPKKRLKNARAKSGLRPKRHAPKHNAKVARALCVSPALFDSLFLILLVACVQSHVRRGRSDGWSLRRVRCAQTSHSMTSLSLTFRCPPPPLLPLLLLLPPLPQTTKRVGFCGNCWIPAPHCLRLHANSCCVRRTCVGTPTASAARGVQPLPPTTAIGSWNECYASLSTLPASKNEPNSCKLLTASLSSFNRNLLLLSAVCGSCELRKRSTRALIIFDEG
jgi:hypothetical protein